MAINCEEHRAYLNDVAQGILKLPSWDETEPITILPGEQYCRIEGCPKATNKFLSTNNLRKHVQAHGVDLVSGGKGGATSLQEHMAAQKFYKALYKKGKGRVAAGSKRNRGNKRKSALVDSEQVENLAENPEKPSLPRLDNGLIDAVAVRKYGRMKMGGKSPCVACKKAKTPCGLTNNCNYWSLYEWEVDAREEVGEEDGEEGGEEDREENEEENEEEDKEGEEAEELQEDTQMEE